jgi:hypothetical protein
MSPGPGQYLNPDIIGLQVYKELLLNQKGCQFVSASTREPPRNTFYDDQQFSLLPVVDPRNEQKRQNRGT